MAKNPRKHMIFEGFFVFEGRFLSNSSKFYEIHQFGAKIAYIWCVYEMKQINAPI